MKGKMITAVLTAAMVCTGVVPMLAVPVKAAETGTTYYVSTRNGKDSNNGTSEKTPFYSLQKVSQLDLQPGDKVLLERGSVFVNGYLHLKGQKGTEEAPIVIDDYGEGGSAPLIQTNGEGVWYQNYGKALDNKFHKYNGYVSSSILLYDSEYIEINDIAMTNKAPEIDTRYNDINSMDRTGVAVVAQEGGTLDHIYLDGLEVKDIKGNVYNKHMNNGGIYFTAYKPIKSGEIPRYNDVQIKNCKVENVSRYGIAVGYTANFDQFKAAEIPDDKIKKYGSTNVVIENNYIKNAGGDGITPMYCDRPLVQYNVSDGVASQMGDDVYSDTDEQSVSAGMWPWKCKNAVFQYNEAFDTCLNGDGQAWDADYGDGTVYQYNYSHNNGGGAVMFCQTDAVNNTFRYNISEDDGRAVITSFGNPDAHVYNNVFYIKDGVNLIWSEKSKGKMVMENNIIYNAAEEERSLDYQAGSTVTYSNNLYYNIKNLPVSDKNAVKVGKDTPVFVDPGKGPDDTNGTSNMGGSSEAKSTFAKTAPFDGYKLAENSPAINKGKVIDDANGFRQEKDFFGDSARVLTPDIGAYETGTPGEEPKIGSDVYEVKENGESGTIEGLGKDTTMEEFLGNLLYDKGVKITVSGTKKAAGKALKSDDIVTSDCVVNVGLNGQNHTYTFIKNSDATIHSSLFEVREKNILVPTVEKNRTTIQEVKDGIEVNELSEITIKDGGKEVKKGKVEDGMILTVTAENGKEETYTLQTKNTYDYADDFVGNQQGNVWFAQVRETDGSYGNMTNWIEEYNMWGDNTDSWEAIGVDKKKNPDSGYLCDSIIPKDRKGGHAMAFRASVDGTVKLSFTDFGGTKKDAYIRDNDNESGNVTIKVTLNGETLEEHTLSNTKEQGVDLQDRSLVVEPGDYIRVEALNKETVSNGGIYVNPIVAYENVKPVNDHEEPTMPAGAKVSDITENSAVLSWEASSDNVGVAGYRVYQKGQEESIAQTGAEERTVRVENLTADTEYTYYIEAFDKAGNVSERAEISFRTQKAGVEKDTEAPTKPSDVKAGEITDSSVVLTWGASKDNVGVSGYRVYQKGTKEPVAQNGPEELALRVSGLAADTEYTYYIEAHDAAGNVSGQAEVTFRTLKAEKPDDGKDDGNGTGNGGTGNNGAGNQGSGNGQDKDDIKTVPAAETDKAVKTGDSAPIGVWGFTLAAAGLMVCVTAGRGRKRKDIDRK